MSQAKKQSKKAILDNLKKNALPGDYYQKERKVKDEDAKSLRTVMLVVTKSKGSDTQSTKWKMLKDGVDPADAVTSRILFRPTQTEMDNFDHKQLKNVGRNIEDFSAKPLALVQLVRRVDGEDHRYHYYWKRVYTAEEEEERKRSKKDKSSRAQALRGRLLSSIAAVAKAAKPRRYASLQRQQAIAQAVAASAVEENKEFNALTKSLAKEEKKKLDKQVRATIAKIKKELLEKKWAAALALIESSPEVLDEHIEDLPQESDRPPRAVSRVPAKDRQPLKYVHSEPIFSTVPKKVVKARPAERTASAKKSVAKKAAKVKIEVEEKPPKKAAPATKPAAKPAAKKAAPKVHIEIEEEKKKPSPVKKAVPAAKKTVPVKKPSPAKKVEEEEYESSAPGAVSPVKKAVPAAKKAAPVKKTSPAHPLKIEEEDGTLTLTLEDKKKHLTVEQEGVLKVEYEPKKSPPKAAPSKKTPPKAAPSAAPKAAPSAQVADLRARLNVVKGAAKK